MPLSVHAVQPASTPPFEDLVKTIQALTAQVAALTPRGNDGRGSRSRSRSRGGGSKSGGAKNARTGDGNDDGVCWYHRKFGADATKCTKPCAFKSGNGKGST